MPPPGSSSLLALTLLLVASQALQFYHPTNELIETLRHQATICPHAHPQWLSLQHTPLSYLLPHPPQGRLLLITLSRNANFLSPAHPHRMTSHPTLVAVFGEHPRERVTTELALEILMRYCHSPPPAADFVLIPIANPRTLHHVDVGQSCQRLNYRFVDLNRNYIHSWGYTDGDTVMEEEEPGVRPLSEFETAAIDALVQRLRPAAYVSVHSGDMAVLVPWDSGEPVGGWIANVANVVRQRHCPVCRVGSARTVFGYRAYGTGVDHMFGVRRVPFACTLEIYGDASDDCGLMFNPGNRSALRRVLRNWSGVLETISREVRGVVPARPSWKDFLIPTGYVVRIGEDGEREAPMQIVRRQAVPTYSMIFVAAVSMAVIAARKAARLIGESRSAARRVTSKLSVPGRGLRRPVFSRSS